MEKQQNVSKLFSSQFHFNFDYNKASNATGFNEKLRFRGANLAA